MSTLSSTSTDAAVEAAYDDNASYEELNDPAKARAFITAARMLLRRLPSMSGTRWSNTQFAVDLIEKQIAEARQWLSASDSPVGDESSTTNNPRVTRASFRNFREQLLSAGPMRPQTNAITQFGGLKSQYAGMTETRFRRRRQGVTAIGRSGDSRAWPEAPFMRMREYVRAMDADDWCIGQLTDRAVEQQVQNGSTLEFNTGDEALDEDLEQRWTDWAEDKAQCDLAGQYTFYEIERLAARSEYIDGDILFVPNVDGALQIVEAHQCRTPSNSKRNIVHGVQLEKFRRLVAYYFAPESLHPFDDFKRVGDADVVAPFDEEGNPQVFQLWKPNRFSMTRGVTRFKAVFDIATMAEDTVFATTVKTQLAAIAAFSFESDAALAMTTDAVLGERFKKDLEDFTQAVEEGVSPGQIFRLPPGIKLNVHNPNLPSDNYFQHVKLLVTFLSIQIGCPLFLALLDGSDTNLSSWRGVWDLVKNTFRAEQQRRISQFYCPVTRWKIRQWLADDPALLAASKRTGIDIFGHKWNPPSWPYLQPLHDAQANAIRVQTGQASLRQVHNENGTDVEDFIEESVNDNAIWIGAAATAAEKLKKDHPETLKDLSWRDLYYRDFYRGGQLTENTTGPASDGSTGRR